MLGALNFGYNVGFGSPASDIMAKDFDQARFNSSVWFRSVIYLSAVPGALTAPALLSFLGRRSVTFIYSGFGAVFWLLFFFTPRHNSFEFAVVVRTLCGLVIGGFSVVIPMYLVETSPPESTGFYGTLNQVAISFGIVVCYSISCVRDPPVSLWRWMSGIGAGICLLSSVLVWFIPESPAITEVNPTMIVGQDNETLWARKWLWPIIVVVLMMLFQQMTGINPLLSNINTVFGKTDANKGLLRAEVARLLTSIAQVIGNLIGAFFTEVLGRRAIWVISLIGVAAMDLAYAIVLLIKGEAITTLVIIIVFFYLFAYGFGAGPIPWFLPAEGFPVKIRPIAGSVNAVANWLFAFGTMWLADPMQKQPGDYAAFFAFAASSVGGTLFGLFFIKNPEVWAREELHPNIFDDLAR
jgi:MFS family permease